MRGQTRNVLNLVQALVLGLFVIFVTGTYVVSSLVQQEVQSKTLTSIPNGVTWVQFYPQWFLQLLFVSILVALTGVLVSLASYVDIPHVRRQPASQFGLSILVVVYFLAMSGIAIYDMITGGPLRIVWFPFVNASAYPITVVIYSAAGIWLVSKFGWKGIVPLVLIGILQEATWNIAYLTLYPFFLADVASQSWFEYVFVIVVAAPTFVFLQRKWFTVHLRSGIWILVLPAYFVLYYLLGMPTVDGPSMTVHTGSLVFEEAYVVACVVTYLKGVEIDARP
jgi:hypothetical protein